MFLTALNPQPDCSKDPFQFEHWIVDRAEGLTSKKTGDKGGDGVMYLYYGLDDGAMGKMIFPVKGGNIRPSDDRGLEDTWSVDLMAYVAGFISLKEPTRLCARRRMTQVNGDTRGYLRQSADVTVKDIVEDKHLF